MKKTIVKIIIGLTKFFLPFIICILGMLSLYLIVDEESVGKLFFLMFAYFLPPLGKESIIPIGVAGGEMTIPFINRLIDVPPINPLIMALTIAFVDIVVALFLLWNYDLAKKIPLIGNFMIKVEKIGRNSSDKYAWVKPLRFVGIILFVMVPFQGSGGLVGSILGRLIGMKPLNTFFAISIGAIIGTLLIAYFADAILSVLVKNLLIGLLILIIILVIGIMIYIYKKNNNFLKN
ncbi:MAG: hypothetical protein AYK22_01080 [Thermoplasmatales archaeon SG8-52-3]|nr:MAG: hypothetical protein AYK22_01080 [Thermoplasmatales archaeon SG8-52-3]